MQIIDLGAQIVKQPPQVQPLHFILEEAIERKYFHMVYQPLVCLKTGKLIGFESLVRLKPPGKDLIPPDMFIPYAEKSGQIVRIGHWVVDQVLVDLEQMINAGLINVNISLNLSPVQFKLDDIFGHVMRGLKRLKLPAEKLKIELTETALIENPAEVSGAFDSFQSSEVRVWLDDFGTGFASLSLLRKFKVDGLKIDRTFVEGIVLNNEDFTLCSAVIAMAQRLGLQIVAEGIETESQMQVLSQLGCDIGQGYFFGKPVVLEEAIKHWGSSSALEASYKVT